MSWFKKKIGGTLHQLDPLEEHQRLHLRSNRNGLFGILLVVLVVCISGVNTACPNGYQDLRGYCFYFGEKQSTWFAALRHCLKVKGMLVSVDSADKMLAISEYLNQKKLLEDAYWISASDLENQGTWLWYGTGNTVNFTHWCLGQPDNFVGEHCGHIHYATQNTFCWNDMPCNWNSRAGKDISNRYLISYICEAPMEATFTGGLIKRRFPVKTNHTYGAKFDVDNDGTLWEKKSIKKHKPRRKHKKKNKRKHNKKPSDQDQDRKVEDVFTELPEIVEDVTDGFKKLIFDDGKDGFDEEVTDGYEQLIFDDGKDEFVEEVTDEFKKLIVDDEMLEKPKKIVHKEKKVKCECENSSDNTKVEDEIIKPSHHKRKFKDKVEKPTADDRKVKKISRHRKKVRDNRIKPSRHRKKVKIVRIVDPSHHNRKVKDKFSMPALQSRRFKMVKVRKPTTRDREVEGTIEKPPFDGWDRIRKPSNDRKVKDRS